MTSFKKPYGAPR